MISDKTSNIDVKMPVQSTTKVAVSVQPKDRGDPTEKSQVKRSEAAQDTEDSKPITTKELEQKQPADQVLSQVEREELKKKVNEAIPKVRELMQKNQRSLDFEVAEEENRVIITVIDKETDRVIRQIPPEDVLQIADSIDQGLESLGGGTILNSKA